MKGGRESWRGIKIGSQKGRGGKSACLLQCGSYIQISHEGRQLIKDHATTLLQSNRARDRYYRCVVA